MVFLATFYGLPTYVYSCTDEITFIFVFFSFRHFQTDCPSGSVSSVRVTKRACRDIDAINFIYTDSQAEPVTTLKSAIVYYQYAM